MVSCSLWYTRTPNSQVRAGGFCPGDGALQFGGLSRVVRVRHLDQQLAAGPKVAAQVYAKAAAAHVAHARDASFG